MTAPEASTEMFRTRRPRVTGFVSIIVALMLAGVSGLLFWWCSVSKNDGAVVGPASAMVLLAILSALIAVLAFQVAGPSSAALPLLGPARLFTILAVVIGVTGAALGVVLGAITGSNLAVITGVGGFFASLAVALQGALVYGAADHRAKSG